MALVMTGNSAELEYLHLPLPESSSQPMISATKICYIGRIASAVIAQVPGSRKATSKLRSELYQTSLLDEKLGRERNFTRPRSADQIPSQKQYYGYPTFKS